jgi:hypothetical protein
MLKDLKNSLIQKEQHTFIHSPDELDRRQGRFWRAAQPLSRAER